MFKYLCIEFPLQTFCGELFWEIKIAWLTRVAASILYSGVYDWNYLSVTKRGYGNKDLFTGPTLEQVQRPFITRVLSVEDVSCVRSTHEGTR